MSDFGFDIKDYVKATSVEVEFKPIPMGSYTLMIEEICEHISKAGAKCIKAVFTVLGPSHEGRKLFEYYSIHNDNEQARNIARERLASLVNSASHSNASKFSQVIGNRVQGYITLDKDGERNRIAGFKACTNSQVEADDTPF